MILHFKMTIAGIVTAFVLDLTEWISWRKRNPGTKYDYPLALARVLLGAFTGLMTDLGIQAGAAITGL